MQSEPLKKPDIILVDDHLIFRQGIKAIINFEDLGTVIGEASNGNEFMELMSTRKPDLVLMDIDMPGMNGIEATQKALEANADLKIIVFTIFDNAECFKRMMDLGAKGFILKTSGLNELEIAIESVMQGKEYFSSEFQGTSKKESQAGNTTAVTGRSDAATPRNNRKMMFFPWMANRNNYMNV